MSKIVVFLGNSGAGKDTCANHLIEKYGYYRIHPIADLKAFYEQHYGLAHGALDTVAGKNTLIPNSDKTFGEMLIDQFHYWESTDPEFTSPFIKRRLEGYLCSGSNVVFTGIRKLPEAKLVVDTARLYAATLKLAVVVRPGFFGQSSDLLLQTALGYLRNHSSETHYLLNTTSKETLLSKLDGLTEWHN